MSRPPDDNRPPIKVVRRNPILSVKHPATGERRNVVPIVSEPTRAVNGIDTDDIKTNIESLNN